MAEAELPNAARHHVHQDLLISNYFGRGFNEFGFHNLDMARITGAKD
jgi:hypothetical protein